MNEKLKHSMPPGWIMYPELQVGSIGWRMGYGESYLDTLFEWLSQFDENTREEWEKLFPKPKMWENKFSSINSPYMLEGSGVGTTWVDFWTEDGLPEYSLENLREEYLQGKSFDFIFIDCEQSLCQDKKLTNSYLSLKYKSCIKANKNDYSCVEQYVMSEKARFFNDEKSYKMVMNSVLPHEMKMYGREVKRFDKKLWSKVVYSVVLAGNYFRFMQNKEMRELLLSTGNTILVNADPHDKKWGNGLEKENQDAKNPVKWKGENLLGFALMEVRKDLQRVFKNEKYIDLNAIPSEEEIFEALLKRIESRKKMENMVVPNFFAPAPWIVYPKLSRNSTAWDVEPMM